MHTLSKFLVEKRTWILIVFLLFAAVSGWLMTQVHINTDMSKYLPADSSTKKGIAIMNSEFPAGSSFKLMFKNLQEEEKAGIRDALSGIEHVRDVAYEAGSSKYNKDGYTLYVVSIDAAANSPAVNAVVDTIRNQYADRDFSINGDAVGNAIGDILPKLAGSAFLILLVILFIMCNSWVEPFLFLFTIAVAILINMGTNAIFESVSDITNSIAAILQLCLSMDYSIMLMNRYRQERGNAENKAEAMKNALRGAFAAISSSSVTTIVGMLSLVFMSFTIGLDLGLVLAKGVLLSLICIFTVLPGLILMFDRALEKTAKNSLRIKMNGIARGSYRVRRVIPIVFVVLFVGSFFLKGHVGITYSMADYYEVNRIFPPQNPVIVLYEKGEEEKIRGMAEQWEADPRVDSVNAYATTLGKKLTYQELAAATGMNEILTAQMYYYYFNENGESTGRSITLGEFMRFLQTDVAAQPQFSSFLNPERFAQLNAMGGRIPEEMMAKEFTAKELSGFLKIDASMADQLYNYYAISHGEMPQGKIALYDFVRFITDHVAANEQFKPYFTAELTAQLTAAKAQLDEGLKQLMGNHFSRLILNTTLPEESADTFDFIQNLQTELDGTLNGKYYIMGGSTMAYEMSRSFPQEMNRITILTAIAIFLVVAIAFRSLSIPLILTCLIQCAVFITMGTVYIEGVNIYYLSLLIVQCLLMGATVDYGILYTSYYREARSTLDKKEAVAAALNHSIHTIMTSALILIMVTGVLGFFFAGSQQSISEILLIVARGGICATLLVVLILPGILVAFDRFVCGKKKIAVSE